MGIAHLIYRRTILIFPSNAHPTTILNNNGIISVEQCPPSLLGYKGIGGHCPFNLSANNFDLPQQCPPYNYP
ncbi:hypothetical protein [Moorena sp. SIO1G6]|uniref:hypothetical protein n=1 Tax=Moorena sp. SIO1G6 TaxID=2607840 RepID=UPI00257E9DDB|nr:hypothetical protein [Moorena sp. SIO1G6]